VDYVADSIVGAAYRVSRFAQILFERFDLSGIIEQEFHVIAAGETQVTATVPVRQVGEEADGLNA